jgi:hypothetical protein
MPDTLTYPGRLRRATRQRTADTEVVVSVELALALRDAGLRWSPHPGDRFVLPHRGMDDDVFVISDMTVEVHDFPSGRVIGFNGVTEWALDSIRHDEALWLPSEAQLRTLLGGLFRRLEVSPDGWFAVTVAGGAPADQDDGESTVRSADAADAYALALLDVLVAVTAPVTVPET